MADFVQEAEQLFEYTRSLRRDFHRHPELGFQEIRTAGIVARELNGLGLEVSTGIAETGVVAILEGLRPGPVVLARFDMDALPIVEETGAPYASENPGVMHACGHDGHTAIGLTVARLLKEHQDEMSGAVKFVFQPAEEGQGGAERMVAEGVLESPKPDLTLSLHLWNNETLGWLGVVPGPMMAAADEFTVRISGKGGHAALPNLTVDPVIAAAQMITALQSIASRNVSPLESAVVSVTSLHAGEAFNVIPSQAELKGTVRTFEPEVRDTVLAHFDKVAEGIAAAFGCQISVDMVRVTPPLINDAEITSRVQQVARQLLPENPLVTDYRTMGSEDMAFMMEQVPGTYFFVGSANPVRGLDATHHHPRFDFDEAALPKAVALMSASIYEFLTPEE